MTPYLRQVRIGPGWCLRHRRMRTKIEATSPVSVPHPERHENRVTSASGDGRHRHRSYRVGDAVSRGGSCVTPIPEEERRMSRTPRRLVGSGPGGCWRCLSCGRGSTLPPASSACRIGQGLRTRSRPVAVTEFTDSRSPPRVHVHAPSQRALAPTGLESPARRLAGHRVAVRPGGRWPGSPCRNEAKWLPLSS